MAETLTVGTATGSAAETGSSIHTGALFNLVERETATAVLQLDAVKAASSSISIADMFEMQMRMNRLSQFSEMSSSVMQAANNTISTFARAIK